MHCTGMPTKVPRNELIRYMLVRLRPVWKDAHVVHDGEFFSAWACSFPSNGEFCSMVNYQEAAELKQEPQSVKFVYADNFTMETNVPSAAWDLLKAIRV